MFLVAHQRAGGQPDGRRGLFGAAYDTDRSLHYMHTLITRTHHSAPYCSFRFKTNAVLSSTTHGAVS